MNRGTQERKAARMALCLFVCLIFIVGCSGRCGVVADGGPLVRSWGRSFGAFRPRRLAMCPYSLEYCKTLENSDREFMCCQVCARSFGTLRSLRASR